MTTQELMTATGVSYPLAKPLPLGTSGNGRQKSSGAAVNIKRHADLEYRSDAGCGTNFAVLIHCPLPERWYRIFLN